MMLLTPSPFACLLSHLVFPVTTGEREGVKARRVLVRNRMRETKIAAALISLSLTPDHTREEGERGNEMTCCILSPSLDSRVREQRAFTLTYRLHYLSRQTYTHTHADLVQNCSLLLLLLQFLSRCGEKRVTCVRQM